MCPALCFPAGPSGRLADKFKGLGVDGLVSPGTILNNGDVTINMQVGGGGQATGSTENGIRVSMVCLL